MDERLRIVIADDDPKLLRLLTRWLSLLGHDLTATAADGLEAVRLIREHQPDLAILDFDMPGLDGVAAATEILREQWLPLLILTGRRDPEAISRASGIPIEAYLLKPCSLDQLRAAISLALQRHQRLSQVHRSRAQLSRQLDEAHGNLSALADGWLTVRPEGPTTASDERVSAWLQEFFPDPARSAETCPGELLVWLADPASSPRFTREHGDRHLSIRRQSHRGDSDTLLLHVSDRAESATHLQSLGLTPREAEVLLWVAEGKSNPEIAIILGGSPRTVDKHMQRILARLGVESRTAAAARALELLGAAG